MVIQKINYIILVYLLILSVEIHRSVIRVYLILNLLMHLLNLIQKVAPLHLYLKV